MFSQAPKFKKMENGDSEREKESSEESDQAQNLRLKNDKAKVKGGGGHGKQVTFKLPKGHLLKSRRLRRLPRSLMGRRRRIYSLLRPRNFHTIEEEEPTETLDGAEDFQYMKPTFNTRLDFGHPGTSLPISIPGPSSSSKSSLGQHFFNFPPFSKHVGPIPMDKYSADALDECEEERENEGILPNSPPDFSPEGSQGPKNFESILQMPEPPFASSIVDPGEQTEEDSDEDHLNPPRGGTLKNWFFYLVAMFFLLHGLFLVVQCLVLLKYEQDHPGQKPNETETVADTLQNVSTYCAVDGILVGGLRIICGVTVLSLLLMRAVHEGGKQSLFYFVLLAWIVTLVALSPMAYILMIMLHQIFWVAGDLETQGMTEVKTAVINLSVIVLVELLCGLLVFVAKIFKML